MKKLLFCTILSLIISVLPVGVTFADTTVVVPIEGNIDTTIGNLYRGEERLGVQLLVDTVGIEGALNYISRGLGDKVMARAKDIIRERRDDNIEFSPSSINRFTYISAQDGVGIDWSRVVDDMVGVVRGESKIIHLYPYTIEASRKYQGKVGEYITLRGMYTTHFNADNLPRSHNITLASSFITGTVLEAGEEFSFNRVVGKRSEERGFAEAPVILNGEMVPGVGGGVCQVSTTLYNAVVLAGLKVGKAQAHSQAVGYVDHSRDVTVSDYIDFTFTNTSNERIYIESSVVRDSITVKIYGYRSEYRYKIKVADRDVPEGYIGSMAYLVKYRGDDIVSTTLLRKDKYKLKAQLESQTSHIISETFF